MSVNSIEHIFESYYNKGRNLRSVALKNYTSGDGKHEGLENVFKEAITVSLKSAGIDPSRYEITNDYFIHPEDESATKAKRGDPQRLDWHVFVDGKCVLVLESRAWIDKPFYVLKRAVIRNFMTLSWVREQLHDDVRFVLAGLAIDIKDRLRETMDETQGFGDRIKEFKFSPYRRGHKGGNYFDHGLNKEKVKEFASFLEEHFLNFKEETGK